MHAVYKLHVILDTVYSKRCTSLNAIQEFVLTITIDFLNFSVGKQGQKSQLNVFIKLSKLPTTSTTFLSVKKNPGIECWILALLYSKGVLRSDNFIDIAFLV